MAFNIFKKSWIHILIWAAMILYFLVAPYIFARSFTRNGKPQHAGDIPSESDRIAYEVDGIEPYTRDGERLYHLFGWAFFAPEEGISSDTFVREVMLISDDTNYSLPVASGYRHPRLPRKYRDMKVDWESLGFSTLIADDLIKPGKYRIGLVFRDTLTGAAYYRDKPVHYLIKTPNTLRLERK